LDRIVPRRSASKHDLIPTYQVIKLAKTEALNRNVLGPPTDRVNFGLSYFKLAGVIPQKPHSPMCSRRLAAQPRIVINDIINTRLQNQCEARLDARLKTLQFVYCKGSSARCVRGGLEAIMLRRAGDRLRE